jgi:hypothetical protein
VATLRNPHALPDEEIMARFPRGALDR